jgi:hypothetical protein
LVLLNARLLGFEKCFRSFSRQVALLRIGVQSRMPVGWQDFYPSMDKRSFLYYVGGNSAAKAALAGHEEATTARSNSVIMCQVLERSSGPGDQGWPCDVRVSRLTKEFARVASSRSFKIGPLPDDWDLLKILLVQ